MADRSSSRPAAAAGRRALPVVIATAALVAIAAAAYVAARQTALFALDRIEVEGASPAVAKQVQDTLGPYLGESLMRFDADEAARRLAGVAEIAGSHFDRAFPHTLRVKVQVERPLAVLRRGQEAWLVSSTARVLRKLDTRPYPSLPRIWVPRTADVQVNSTLGGTGAKGVAAIAPLRALRVRADVRQVRANDQELTIVLGSGTEVRLGDSGDLRLKLAIAKRMLPVTIGARYVDISVPERPVASYDSQVEG